MEQELNDKLKKLYELSQKQNEDIMQTKEKIQLLSKMLTGNGDPENGVIVKYSRQSEIIKSIIRTLNIHWALISGSMLAVLGLAIRVLLA